MKKYRLWLYERNNLRLEKSFEDTETLRDWLVINTSLTNTEMETLFTKGEITLSKGTTLEITWKFKSI